MRCALYNNTRLGIFFQNTGETRLTFFIFHQKIVTRLACSIFAGNIKQALNHSQSTG